MINADCDLSNCFGNREAYRKPDRLTVSSGTKVFLWSFLLILSEGGNDYVFQA